MSSLRPAERRLVELLQELNFGRVESLFVRAGAPLLEPAPKIIKTLKMGGQNGPREETGLNDFLLKSSVVELLAIIRTLRDDEVLTITVMHGLPHLVEIERRGAR
jgi:hypothetical protein